MKKTENNEFLDTLQYTGESDKMNLLKQVQSFMEKNRRKEILEKHPYSVWQGTHDKWYTYLPADEDGPKRKIKRNTREEIEDIIVDYWEQWETNPKIQDVFDQWNDYKTDVKGDKKSTKDRTRQTFDRHFGDIKDIRIKDISPEQWALFLQEQLDGKKLRPRAWGNLRALFRGMIKYAGQHGYVNYTAEPILDELDIGRNTFKEKPKDDAKDSFSLRERDDFINYISDPDHRTIHHLGLLLMFVTGMRIGEVVSLRFDDIEGNCIHVHRTETRYHDGEHWVYKVDDKPKTEAGDRKVPIPDDYLWILDECKRLNPDGEYIFSYRGKRITTHSLRKQVYKVCDKIGIEHKGPHKSRKTYLSILMESGMPDYMITRVAGHTNIKTTEAFYLRDIGYGKEAEVINSIPEMHAKRKAS